MHVPLVGNPTYTEFEEYKDVLKTDSLDFLEDRVTWVTSKISCAIGALGAEAIDIRNCIIIFRCASEKFRVVLANLAHWMANYLPPRMFTVP